MCRETDYSTGGIDDALGLPSFPGQIHSLKCPQRTDDDQGQGDDTGTDDRIGQDGCCGQCERHGCLSRGGGKYDHMSS